MSGFRLEGCCALITGASAGIGREFARQLTGQAGALVLVARRVDRLEELRAELTARDPNLNVLIRATDLADPRGVHELGDWIEQQQIAVDLLVNNAGLGDVGSFATADAKRVDEMILVNVLALTALTRRLLPAMIARKRGAILNVSSSAGFLPIAGFAVYAATKAYVTSFSEALRGELRGTGIPVTALCPGPVRTEFFDVANRTSAASEMASPEFTHVAVEEVVRAALDAVEHDRAIIVPGWLMKVGMALVRLTPMPVLRMASELSAKKSATTR